MDNQSKVNHWCIVPMCKNTSKKTPDKTFIQVPKNEKRRKLWLQIVRREPKEFSKTSNVFICEDHFDLENDMENYLRWKLMGGQKIMKSDAIPHKFECQQKRKLTFSQPIPRKAVEKRKRAQEIEEALSASSSSNTLVIKNFSSNLNEAVEQLPKYEAVEQPQQCEAVDPPQLNISNQKDVGVTVRPYYRSKQTQTVYGVSCKSCSPIIPVFTNIGTSPFASKDIFNTNRDTKPFKKKLDFSSSDSTESTSSLYVSDKTVLQGTSSDETNLENIFQQEYSKLAYTHTSRLIELYPKRYVGLSKECMYVIDLLEKRTLSDRRSIYVTLQKVKLAQTFAELGDAFGISESSASRMFSTNIVLISSLLKELIIWPLENRIKKQLPSPFRVRYANVQCIIDCLEIEIQKPSDAVKQALTWSEYKKANTIKYLISSTPDGIINFISCGFGGRTSDAGIVEESGFLDKLQPSAAVMADRGFKHVEHLFIFKKCTLVRPPSVSAGQKLSKSEVLQTKRIASLRIHIERVIRRLQEYRLLKPHSCVHSKLIPLMDCAVIIACGLINLQGPIVK